MTAPGRTIGREKPRAEPELDQRTGAIAAWRTSRAEFEDLEPFKGGGPAKLKHWDSTDTGALGISSWLLSLGGDKEVTRPYLQNPWVYACVQANARAIGSLKVQFSKGQGDEKEIVEGTELNILFNGPNPLQSPSKFLKALTNNHLLWGETYLLLLKEVTLPAEDGKPARTIWRPVEAKSGQGMTAMIETPTEIWPVAGHLVEEVIDKNISALPIKYRIHSGTGTTTYPAHAVAHIADANPHSMLRGVGALTAVLRDVAKAYQIDRYDEALLRNGGTPGGVLSIDGPITDDELRATRTAWREAQEKPESHRKTAILPFGTKFETHGFTPKEMDFAAFREWIRQTIMAVFGVTKPILGITDDVSMANSREAYRVFWETTIVPLVRFFEDEFNYRLMRRLADPKLNELSFALDLSGVEALREDMDAKVARALKIYKDGHRTFNESAALASWTIGEDMKLEGADERWIPANLLPPPLASAGPPEPPPAAGSEDDSEEDEDADGKTAPSNPTRDAARDAYWRAHDAYLRGHEAQFARRTFSVYRSYLRALEARLDEIAAQARGAPEDGRIVRYVVTEAELDRLLGLNTALWNAQLFASLSPAYLAVISESVRRLVLETGGGTTMLLGTDPVVLDFLRSKELAMIEGFTSTIAQAVQKKMVAVLATAPANLPTLASAIADVLDQLKEQVQIMQGQAGRRAMMIARTEVTSAVSFARFEQMGLDGIKEHTWLSSQDAQVREHHQELDGKTVAIGQEFGFGLKFPGDPNGAPEDVINCRCTVLPELPERAIPAPNLDFYPASTD